MVVILVLRFAPSCLQQQKPTANGGHDSRNEGDDGGMI
jgi:hypothetical protein